VADDLVVDLPLHGRATGEDLLDIDARRADVRLVDVPELALAVGTCPPAHVR
jgi:hypothetical protein